MTKSTITRERIQRIIRAIDSEAYDEEEIREWLSSDEIMELARMALAAMDSEPVAWLVGEAVLFNPDTVEAYAKRSELPVTPLYAHPPINQQEPVAWDYEWASCITCEGPQNFNRVIEREAPPEWAINEGQARNIIPLYRHAQPAPDYPETLPCPVLLEPGMRFGKGVKTRLVLEAIQRRAEYYAELEVMTPEERAEHDANMEAFKLMLPQPLPVASAGLDKNLSNDVLDEIIAEAKTSMEQYLALSLKAEREAWRQCQPTDDERIMAIEGIIPPISAGNSPIIPDGYVMVPKEPTDEMLAAAKDWTGLTSTAEVVYIKMLAAAPQSPGSEPATVPGKWIPVSERMPEDEQEVLTINRMGHCFVSFFDKHSGLFFDRLDAPAACCIEHVLVTHWMTLPAAPQEVK